MRTPPHEQKNRANRSPPFKNFARQFYTRPRPGNSDNRAPTMQPGGGIMGLKRYRLDLPTALVASFMTLADSEAEALELITAALAGDPETRKRVDVVQSQPVECATQRRIRSAEPGTPEEKLLLGERLYPAFALIQMEVTTDED